MDKSASGEPGAISITVSLSPQRQPAALPMLTCAGTILNTLNLQADWGFACRCSQAQSGEVGRILAAACGNGSVERPRLKAVDRLCVGVEVGKDAY